MKTISLRMIPLGLAAALLATAAFAHGDHDPNQGREKPPPFAILQLDQVRDATARYRDVEKAEAAGYHDIGLFVPNMGWHYMKDSLVDGRFDPTKPELLVFADDPCGVPYLIVRGRIGGSAMTAAAINALARAGL